jgi:hypothetical protein
MLYLCTPLSEKAGLRCTLGKPAPPRTSFSALQKARPRRRHARAVRLRTHTRVHAMCTPQDGMLLIQPDPRASDAPNLTDGPSGVRADGRE